RHLLSCDGTLTLYWRTEHLPAKEADHKKEQQVAPDKPVGHSRSPRDGPGRPQPENQPNQHQNPEQQANSHVTPCYSFLEQADVVADPTPGAGSRERPKLQTCSRNRRCRGL